MHITALSDYVKGMPFYNHVYNNFYGPHTWLHAKCELCRDNLCMHAQIMYVFSICVIIFIVYTLVVNNDTSQIGVYVLFHTRHITLQQMKTTHSFKPTGYITSNYLISIQLP